MIPPFLKIVFIQYSFLQSFIFNISVSLYFKCVSSKQYIVKFHSFIQSDDPCLLIGNFRRFSLTTIIYIFGFQSTIFPRAFNKFHPFSILCCLLLKSFRNFIITFLFSYKYFLISLGISSLVYGFTRVVLNFQIFGYYSDFFTMLISSLIPFWAENFSFFVSILWNFIKIYFMVQNMVNLEEYPWLLKLY